MECFSASGIVFPQKTCPFCGATWFTRVPQPVRCPRCIRVLPVMKSESKEAQGADILARRDSTQATDNHDTDGCAVR